MGLYFTLGTSALLFVCISIIAIQAKSIKNYRTQNENLRKANQEAAYRLLELRDYMAKNKIVEEEADEKRRELEKTPNGDLAHRANTLFGGVREPGNASS